MDAAVVRAIVHLDPGLPPRAPAGRELVWAFSGWAWREGAHLTAVAVVVAGQRFAAARVGSIRFDCEPILRKQGVTSVNPACGFLGLAVLPAGQPGAVLAPLLVLEWSDGVREERAAGTVAVVPPSPATAVGGDRRLVAIAMATYNPDPDLFRIQIDSIRAQTHGDWVCLIEDDGSSDAHWRAIEAAIAGDDRFRPVRNAVNLGFYRNFERALWRVPADAAFVALADQDDRWAADKLAALVAAVEAGGAALAFADMRVVDRGGGLLSPTFWPGRDSRCDHLDALLMANAVTGCACLFRSALLPLVLPFPALGRTAYHDHWIACVAAAAGGIAYLPRPLGDYVQHGANSLGYRRRPGLRLAVRVVAALMLSPVLALAGRIGPVRRRLARPLGLLVDLTEAELACRTAFAEALRRRVRLDADGAAAVATFPAERLRGLAALRPLLAALLRRGRRGRAFRGVAARLIAGTVIGALTAPAAAPRRVRSACSAARRLRARLSMPRGPTR